MRKTFWARTACLAILTIRTVSIGPAAAQTYDPDYPVCMNITRWGAVITNAATRRSLSATRRHRAAPLNASSIHILRARDCPRADIIAAHMAASTRHN